MKKLLFILTTFLLISTPGFTEEPYNWTSQKMRIINQLNTSAYDRSQWQRILNDPNSTARIRRYLQEHSNPSENLNQLTANEIRIIKELNTSAYDRNQWDQILNDPNNIARIRRYFQEREPVNPQDSNELTSNEIRIIKELKTEAYDRNEWKQVLSDQNNLFRVREYLQNQNDSQISSLNNYTTKEDYKDHFQSQYNKPANPFAFGTGSNFDSNINQGSADRYDVSSGKTDRSYSNATSTSKASSAKATSLGFSN